MRVIDTRFNKHIGEQIFVVGTGTSLRHFDFLRLAGRTTIALNNAVFSFNPTYHLFHDEDIWERYRNIRLPSSTFVVTRKPCWARLMAHPSCSYIDQVLLYIDGKVDTAKGSPELWIDHTVATGAVQLAWKLGAQEVYLLGVDAYRYPDADYYTDPPSKEEAWSEQRDICFALDFRRLWECWHALNAGPPGGVYNCSMNSLIDVFPKVDIDSVLGKGIEKNG